MNFKVKNFFFRSAPLILVCCMFVFVFSPSAFALFSYEDFISNMEVDGQNEIITVTLPIDRTMLQVWNSDWSVIARENGSSISFYASELAHYHFGIYPMYGDALSVSDLPNGSSLTFSYSVYPESTGFQQPTSFGEFTYYNAAGVELRNDRVAGPTQAISDTYSFTFTLNKPDSADNCSFSLHLGDFMGYYSGRVTLIVKEIKMGISISALYRQQQLTGKTNKLLDEVNRQLEEQGKDLDQIINGEVIPEAPEGADKVGDLDNAEGQLRDDAQIGLDQGVEIQQTVLQILEEYAAGFTVFSWIFGLFAKLPFFTGLLYVSVALGSVASLLNLGLSAQSASRRSHKRKKGG